MALVELYAGSWAEARYRRRSSFECVLGGGRQDFAQAKEVAEAWFKTEEARTAAHSRAEQIARTLVRSPKGWTAVQAVAGALLDRGRLDGDEVDTLCAAAYDTPFRIRSLGRSLAANAGADPHRISTAGASAGGVTGTDA